MSIIDRIIDNKQKNSLATLLHRKRFILFNSMINSLPRPITILDVGGTEIFWKTMGFTNEPGIEIILLNKTKVSVDLPNFTSIVGDARDMSIFKEREVDIVFSNSVIEHLGKYENQLLMAQKFKELARNTLSKLRISIL